MNERRLIADLALALTRFAELPIESGYQSDYYRLNHEDIIKARMAIDKWELWAKDANKKTDPMPWGPGSACDVGTCERPTVDGDPGDQAMATPEWAAEMRRKRDAARQEAKRLLSSYFMRAWQNMGCKWQFHETANVCAIVDAILTAAGA